MIINDRPDQLQCLMSIWERFLNIFFVSGSCRIRLIPDSHNAVLIAGKYCTICLIHLMTNMHHLMILWLYILHYLTIANHSLFSERLLNKFFQVYWVCLQSWWCFSYITWIKTQVCTYIISLCKDDDKTSSASEWKWCQFPQRTDKFNTSFTLSRKSEFQLFQVVLYLCELGQGI